MLSSSRLRICLLLCAVALRPLTACQRDAAMGPAPTRSGSGATPLDAAAAAALDPSRLPEDEAAGLRSQAQWREHLAHEEEERQLLFDRQRLKAHAAVLRIAEKARARYDAARSEAAVLAVQKEMPRHTSELRSQVSKLDPWGVNSRLLQDYAWFARALDGPYGEAKLSALQGEGSRLSQLGSEFDVHLEKAADWLRKAAESEEERERESEPERPRKH